MDLDAGGRNLVARIEQNLVLTRDRVIATFLQRGERVGDQLTGDAFRDRVLRLAGHLETCLPEGGPVLLIMPPSLECSVALVACLYAGIAVAPLPVPHPGAYRDRLDAVIADSCARAILCTQESAQVLTQHLAQGTRSGLPTLIRVDDLLAQPGRIGHPRCAGFDRSVDDTAVIQYTSGSTRQPRGVLLSHRNLLSNTALASERWRLGADTVSVNWLPNYHDMGLMGGTICPLLWGAPCIQMSPLAFAQKPSRWLRAIGEHRATLSGGPAFAFALCLDAIDERESASFDLSSWRAAFCGAEPVPADLLPRFRERFRGARLDPAAVFACYGLAESTLYVAGERVWGEPDGLSGDGRTEPCRLAPSTRANLRIVDPLSGQPRADGEEGEIWVAGPSVASGYHNQPEETRATFDARVAGDPRSFMRTGDLGLLSGNALHVTGRLKDVLIAHGANVAAVDIEWLAAEAHPALNPMAAAAFSLNAAHDERGALLIEVRHARAALEDAEALAEAIRARVGATFGIDLAWVRFVKRGGLERTTSGKVRRQAVAARVRAGHRYPEVQA
ncbi:fatty acyl-AMP ligase [Pseudomonas sp. RIT-PI-AD]|uniref:fatty acyl-AMP ligase n=1 Tax=Pseudomonas sp. RIT-PI-AD TaxID=3035294 RepID=UPI0021DA491F|nr:fatty acyl-AMP ligase [Pseudomonas sp. RIT-PI-AD]